MIKILIADDQELIRQSLMIILNSEGSFEVTDAVANGVEVIRSVRRERPDVILMDIRMPIMNGYEATREIRSLPRKDVKNLPIIAMTANALEEDKEAAIKNGMNAHISKPLDMDIFMKVLRQYLH